MKNLMKVLLVLVMFVGVTNVYGQQTKAVQEKREELKKVIAQNASNDAASFEIDFDDENQAMLAIVKSKASELDELGSQAPELFWHVLYTQWNLQVRTNMCMQLNVIYMELVMYNSKGKEIGRYKDRLVK